MLNTGLPPDPAPNPPGIAGRLGALYAVAFGSIGVAAPFLPVWLAGRGFDATLVGLLLAVPILARIALSAPMMSLADRGTSPRIILALGYAASAATYALMDATDAPLALAALLAVNAVAAVPLIGTTDYLALDAVRRAPGRLVYGRVRVAGSIAYLVANVAAGLLLTPLPGATAVLLALISGAGVLVALAAAPRAGAPQAAPAGGAASLPAALWLGLVAAALIQASHSGVYGFGSIRWREAGLSNAAVGLLWAVGVAAEIVLFAFAARAGRLGPFGLIALGGGAALVRWLGLAFVAGEPLALAALQCLHGLSFGATHLGTMAALARDAPPGRRGRAQGTLAAVMALTAAGATVLAGTVYRHAGGTSTFLAMGPIALGGLALLGLAARAAAGRPTSPPPTGGSPPRRPAARP